MGKPHSQEIADVDRIQQLTLLGRLSELKRQIHERIHMPEIIADLDTTVVSQQHEYYAQVVGEQLPSGLWEGWLEFAPLADDQDVLITKTETTQPTREDLTRWSETLTPVYVEGAFVRAVQASGNRSLVRRYDTRIADSVVFDPFDMLRRVGKHALRARLRALTRPELLTIIREYALNPAGKSLARLSDSQLAIFIVTAVEVQAERGQ